jgi:hypothetical protein
MYEVSLRYSEPLLHEAVRFFVVRAVLRQLGSMFFIVVGGLILALAWYMYIHERGWIIGFLVATILFVGVFIAMIYVAHHRNTIGRFRQMRTPEATFSYDEQVVCFTSELGSSTMPWSAITEVWRHDRFWLLLFSRSQFVTLPLDSLDESTRDFIDLKVNQSRGGRGIS